MLNLHLAVSGYSHNIMIDWSKGLLTRNVTIKVEHCVNDEETPLDPFCASKAPLPLTQN